jgi:hypothetical protein
MTVSPAATSKMRKNANLLNKLGVIKDKMINSGGKHISVSSLNHQIMHGGSTNLISLPLQKPTVAFHSSSD